MTHEGQPKQKSRILYQHTWLRGAYVTGQGGLKYAHFLRGAQGGRAFSLALVKVLQYVANVLYRCQEMRNRDQFSKSQRLLASV